MNGTSYTNSNVNIWIGNHIDAYSSHCFFRFQNVNIPKDSTITSALVRFQSTQYNGGYVYSNIYIEAADDPTAPTNGADLIGRSLGSGVAWDGSSLINPGVYFDTPSIASILQTHVARAGWVSGNALTIHIKNDGSSNYNYFRAASYENVTYDQAELIVEYTAPTTSSTTTTTTTSSTSTISTISTSSTTPPSYQEDFTGGQTYSAGRFQTGFEPAKAFDNNNSTTWYSGVGDVADTWIQVELSEAKTARRLRMRSSSNASDSPEEFTFKASNTGAFSGEEVTLLDEVVPTWTDSEWKTFDFSNGTAYTYYRVHVTLRQGGPQDNGRCQLSEIEMMEFF